MPHAPTPVPTALRAFACAATLALAACATVPDAERLLWLDGDGKVATGTRACGAPAVPAAGSPAIEPAPVVAAGGESPTDALDPAKLRVASWNVHKGEDDGWQTDLAAYAAEHDLLLLQEAVLTTSMRDVLEKAGYRWSMAGAFSYDGSERGVLIAARARPIGGCTLRVFEPLFPLPKSAIITRYRLAGREKLLTVANLHGINFTLGLERFTQQLEAVAAELARNDGPIILGGDFNTWSEERHRVLSDIAARLNLKEVELAPDGRRRTFGWHLDHLFVRGFHAVQARAPEVKSSDHNPLLIFLSAP